MDDVRSNDLVAFMRRWAWQLLAAATSFVILISGWRGLAAGYEPVGDNALIELRARDVLTGDHPFLGTWSSASISSGIHVNHPGPLLFELVAVPLRLVGGAAGIALGVMALHIAGVWVIGYVAHRIGGQTTAIATLTVTAGLVWTLGSELLYDPWQPNALVLPFWLFVCTVWAIVAGEVALFPLACGVGSFVMQTHLGYLFIVPILLAFGAIAAWRAAADRHTLRRPALQSIAVSLVLWAQPLWEQFFGPGRGNLGRVVTAGTGRGGDFQAVENTRTGLALGLRILGSVLALPPWWGRPGYDDSIPNSTQTVTDDGLEIDATGLRALAPSVVGLLLLLAALVVGWWIIRRAGERRVEAGYATLTVALVVAAMTVMITPVDILGLTPHKVRWLWVIGAFATLMLVMSLLVAVGESAGARARQGGVAALFALASVGLLATIPTHANGSGPVYFEVTYPSITSIRQQVSDHLDAEPDGSSLERVLFDAGGIGFAEPYTAPVMAEFLEHGVDLVVAEPALSRQLGPDRLATSEDPTDGGTRVVVYVRAGQAAAETPDGAARIAFHDGDRTPFSVDDVTDRAVAVFVVKEPVE